MKIFSLETPLADSVIKELRAGDSVTITGAVFTARDAAHKEITRLIAEGRPAPFPFRGQIVYYAGPCPGRPGSVIGSVGPTTAGRMDRYAEQLIPLGLKAMIGKGRRSGAVIQAIKDCGGVYFAAIGGAGALLSSHVERAELIAFPELGPEAVYRLSVVRFPAVVAIDSVGNDIYAAR